MEVILQIAHSFSGPVGYLLIFLALLACGFGIPIPEDIILFTGGVLAYMERVDLYGVTLISFAGVMIGDSTMYFLGAKYGRHLTEKPFFHTILPPYRLAIVKEKLHKSGNRLMFMARFMPGLRSPIFFSAGMLHLPFRTFFLYDGSAALISVPTIIFTVYYAGSKMHEVIEQIEHVERIIAVVVIAVLAFAIGKLYLISRKEKQEEEG